MGKIIGISGRKQAGKNTVANYITGYSLLQLKMIQDFYIDKDGSLVVKTVDSDNNSGYGILDLLRKDESFVEYAEKNLWPYIKIYHFADPLKEMSVNLFNLDPAYIYGDNDSKNSKTDFEWKNMPSSNKKSGNLTVREFLEYFGTKIVRKIYDKAWSEFTLKRINKEQSSISIIPDVRFPNEVKAIKDNGGIVIRLTRNIHNSDFEAESALDKDNFDWSNFDYIIENDNISLTELSSKLSELNHLWSTI
jgi:hypothetical protein